MEVTFVSTSLVSGGGEAESCRFLSRRLDQDTLELLLPLLVMEVGKSGDTPSKLTVVRSIM